MSLWLRIFVVLLLLVFLAAAVALGVSGEWKAAAGAMVPVVLISPLSLEVFFPGRYVLRMPPPGEKGGIFWSIKKFREEHPGWFGAFILYVYIVLLGANFAGGLYWIGKALL